MSRWLIEWILAEGRWLTVSMVLAGAMVAVLAARRRSHGGLRIPAGLDVFYGCMIGTMAFGHLLAVTVKAWQGTLAASLWLLYPLGLVLLGPSVVLALAAGRREPGSSGGLRIGLNLGLLILLLGLGLHNWPLAFPAALNLAYRFSPRPAIARVVLSVAVLGYCALFLGGLVFLASGQSFEQFSGIEP